MTHSRIRSDANWTAGSELGAAEMKQLDTNVSNSVDKTSAGDTISGPLILDVTSSVTFESGSSLTVESGGSFQMDTGSIHQVDSDGYFTADLRVVQNLQVDTDATVTGNLTVGNEATAGTVHVTDELDIQGDATAGAQLIFSGANARTKWRVTELSDADGNISTSADIYLIPALLSAHRTYTVQTTSATVGNTIRICRLGSTVAPSFNAYIQELGDVGYMATLTGNPSFCEIVYTSSGWRLIDWSADATAGSDA